MRYLNCIEGNIFFIPLFLPSHIKDNRKSYRAYQFLPSERYAYGRLIEINKSSGDLVEIFSYVDSIPENIKQVTDTPLLMNPAHVTMGFWKERWRFIFETDGYCRESHSNYSEITFLLGDNDRPILWKGGIQSPLNSHEEKNFAPWIVYPPTQFEELIREKIA